MWACPQALARNPTPNYCCSSSSSFGFNSNTISHFALLLVFVALSGLAATFAVLFVARRILYPPHQHTQRVCACVCAGVSKCRFAGVTFTVYATLAPHVLSTKTSITFSRPGLCNAPIRSHPLHLFVVSSSLSDTILTLPGLDGGVRHLLGWC